jgi:hypothetical protein
MVRYCVNRIHVLLRLESWNYNKKAYKSHLQGRMIKFAQYKRPCISKVAAYKMERPKDVNLHQ